MTQVITHGGRAHRDEFLSIGVLLHAAVISPSTPIWRRNPTHDELEDYDNIIIDIGNKHQPELRNFDHHQFNGRMECALSLVAKHYKVPRLEPLTYHDLFEEFPWYHATVALDAFGPRGLAKVGLKLDMFPDELNSPVELSILDMMSRQPQVSTFIKDISYETIKSRVEASMRLVDRLKDIESRGVMWWADGNLILQYEGDSFGVSQYRKKNGIPITISVVKDTRDDAEGWCLYRFSGDVDFTQVVDERVTYTHPEGFLAKTRGYLERGELRDIIRKARKE